jgi:hypothetical protein
LQGRAARAAPHISVRVANDDEFFPRGAFADKRIHGCGIIVVAEAHTAEDHSAPLPREGSMEQDAGASGVEDVSQDVESRSKARFGLLNYGGGVGSQGSFVEPDQDGSKRIGTSFYRGETVNYGPRLDDYESAEFLEKYILKGWLPAGPVLTPNTRITAFGSCFASHITKHLMSLGYSTSKGRAPDLYISSMGEGLVNTYSLLGQFEWALENKRQPVDLWHGFKAEGYGYDERIRVRTRDVFRTTEFFIITLGLSEIWYDEVTGGVFWRAVPLNAFDPSRHKFRVSTVAESKANLASMYALIRKHAPSAKVLFTLSPIPLAATFRPVSCVTANSVSKAVLRAALDEFLRENNADVNERLFYFPSYEILNQVFADPWMTDARHPAPYAVNAILKTFEAVYCCNETSLAEAGAFMQECRTRNRRQIGARERRTERATQAHSDGELG